jgi:hypothetical protein
VELARSREAEKLQYQLDGLQTRMFRMEELLKSGEQLQARVREAEVAVAALAAAREVLATMGDPTVRLAAFDRATARRDEALGKLAEERQALDEPSGPPVPFWRSRAFLGGLGVAVAALVAGMATPLGALALLAIPASGGSTWIALRWISASERHERVERRSAYLADRERKIRETWERDGAEVRAAIQATGTASSSEARELWDRVREAEAALEGERRRVVEWEEKAETRDAAADRARLQREIGEIEARLTADSGGYVRDPATVEQEIARVDAELQAPDPGPAGDPVPAASAPVVDPLRALMERAAAETGQTPGTALRGIQQRLSLLLGSLSGQRLGGLLVDERGNLVVQGAGRSVPVGTLAPAERDVCYLALRVAFLEGAIAGNRAVALLADPFGGLPEAARRILARQLKQMARSGQVIHATADVVFREAADHAS